MPSELHLNTSENLIELWYTQLIQLQVEILRRRVSKPKVVRKPNLINVIINYLNIIYMKKLLDSDWSRVVQSLCNSVQKCAIP